MRHLLVTITALLSLSGIGTAQSTNKPLKPAYVAYEFRANVAGDNGQLWFAAPFAPIISGISSMGPGVSGVTTAGTNASWTFVGNFIAAGAVLEPVTGIFPGSFTGLGYLDVGGTVYPWHSVPPPIHTNMQNIIGESFTFPQTCSETTGTFTVEVPAKLFMGNELPEVTLFVPSLGVAKTWRLLVRHGTLRLTWYCHPPSVVPPFPAGSFSFKSGFFFAQSPGMDEIEKHDETQ